MRDHLGLPDGIIALGGNDEGGWGYEKWGWEDGRTSWSYENWEYGEPNGYSSENCLAIWPAKSSYNYWYDVSCNTKLSFICQVRNCYGLRGHSQEDYCCRDSPGGTCPVWGGHCWGDAECRGGGQRRSSSAVLM